MKMPLIQCLSEGFHAPMAIMYVPISEANALGMEDRKENNFIMSFGVSPLILIHSPSLLSFVIM